MLRSPRTHLGIVRNFSHVFFLIILTSLCNLTRFKSIARSQRAPACPMRQILIHLQTTPESPETSSARSTPPQMHSAPTAQHFQRLVGALQRSAHKVCAGSSSTDSGTSPTSNPHDSANTQWNRMRLTATQLLSTFGELGFLRGTKWRANLQTAIAPSKLNMATFLLKIRTQAPLLSVSRRIIACWPFTPKHRTRPLSSASTTRSACSARGSLCRRHLATTSAARARRSRPPARPQRSSPRSLRHFSTLSKFRQNLPKLRLSIVHTLIRIAHQQRSHSDCWLERCSDVRTSFALGLPAGFRHKPTFKPP